MNAKNKNMLWGAIALLGLGFLLMGNNIVPSPQATAPQPDQQTPGMIQWDR